MVKVLVLRLLVAMMCVLVSAIPASKFAVKRQDLLSSTSPSSPEIEDPATRSERSTNLSLHASRKIQLFIKNRHLQLLPDGTVNGTLNASSNYKCDSYVDEIDVCVDALEELYLDGFVFELPDHLLGGAATQGSVPGEIEAEASAEAPEEIDYAIYQDEEPQDVVPEPMQEQENPANNQEADAFQEPAPIPVPPEGVYIRFLYSEQNQVGYEHELGHQNPDNFSRHFSGPYHYHCPCIHHTYPPHPHILMPLYALVPIAYHVLPHPFFGGLNYVPVPEAYVFVSEVNQQRSDNPANNEPPAEDRINIEF